MATKNNPGKFDCYARADPDEPIFVLRANDELAPIIVQIWALLLGGDHAMRIVRELCLAARSIAQQKTPLSDEKFDEAMKCSLDMIEWKKSHGK